MLSIARATCSLRGLADLEVFGIKPLTGEACAYSQRILCDVNEDGQRLLEEFLGVPELSLAPPMNRQVNELSSAGSIMLTRGMWRDLAKFALFHLRALAYVELADTIVGIFDAQRLSDYEVHPELSGLLVRNYSIASTMPHVGSRNVHQMTGRVV